MENLINYLHEVLDENSTLNPFEEAERLPIFLREIYRFESVVVGGKSCVLLFLKSGVIEISKIQKHFSSLLKYTNAYPVLVLTRIRSTQRKKLLENRIPFIVPGTQLYLPFVSVDLREQYPSTIEEKTTFTAIEQAVCLSLFYCERQCWGVSDVAKKINVTDMSVSRALRSLELVGIVNKFGVTTKIKYQRIDKKNYYLTAKKHLSTPVSKVVYIENANLPPKIFLAGEEAFAAKTMLGYPARKTYAVDKITFKKIPKEHMIDESIMEDNYVRLEVWKYDPGLFAIGNIVDDLSLLLSLEEIKDERIAIETEKLLEELLCAE